MSEIKRYSVTEQELTVYMIHHSVLVLLESLQEIVPFLKLLEGLMVGRTFFLRKTAQLFNLCFGTIGRK